MSGLTRRAALGLIGGAAAASASEGTTRMANDIEVRAAAGATTGSLRFGAFTAPCAVGKTGILTAKREGDHATPQGDFALRGVRYRADRLARVETALPLHVTLQSDGWCDAAADPNYNRPVDLPYAASAEHMWRDDHLYDALAVIGYNDGPVVPGAGSAIFLHVAREKDGVLQPTVGCVSLRLPDLLHVLARVAPATRISIALGA